MTNPQNVTVVVDKLIGFLKAATDNFMRIDLLSRISQLSEKYAPSNDWFITAMNNTMELAGEQCKPEYAHNVMKLIIDNASGNAGEEDIREFAVDTYLHLLATRKVLPDLLVQVSAWVIGEYGHTSRQSDSIGQLHALMTAMDRTGPDQAITKGWIISAMLKIVARHGHVPAEVVDIVQRYQNSQQVDLQQRAHEFIELAKAPQLLAAVMPADQASLEVSVDSDLTFLDGYVNAALQAGAKPYQPRSEFGLHERKEDGHGLKFAAYAAAPQAAGHGAPPAAAARDPYQNTDPNAPAAFFPGGSANGGHAQDHGSQVSTTGLQGVKERKWGPKGFNDPQKQAQEQAAAAQLQQSPYGGPPSSSPSNVPQQQQQGGFGGSPGHDQHYGQQQHPDYNHGQQQQSQQQGGGFGGARQRAPPPVSEKEKLASSLFAGLSTGGPGGGAPGGFKRPTPTAGPPGQPRIGAPHAGGPSPPPQQPQQQQPPRQVDLLGGFADGGAGAPPQRMSGGAPGAPALDLLAGSPSPPPGGGPLDLFSAVGGGDAGIFGLAGAAPAIQAQLGGMPKSHKTDVPVVTDARVQVSYIKAYGGEATTIAVFVSNKTPQPVANATLTLSIPPGFSGNFTGEPTPTARPGAQPGTHNVIYPQLAPSQTVSLLMNLSVRELTFLSAPSLAIAGQLSVAGAAPLLFSVPMELSDMLRPAQMTTPQYVAQPAGTPPSPPSVSLPTRSLCSVHSA